MLPQTLDRAAAADYVLVTKDDDFHRFSVLYGPPPKVVWVRLGNCTTDDVAQLLRQHAMEIREFSRQDDIAFMALG